MTQTAHVAAREAVYQILREALRLGMELRPKMLRSGAALPHERIYESLIPLRKIKELQRRRMALDTANTCAPSTPEPAIMNRISHPIRDISSLMRDISSCISRARASFTSCPRTLRCTEVYGFGIVLADPGRALPYDRPTRTWETGFPDIRGRGRAIQQQGHSAPPRLPTGVRQELREHEQRALQSARQGQGRVAFVCELPSEDTRNSLLVPLTWSNRL